MVVRTNESESAVAGGAVAAAWRSFAAAWRRLDGIVDDPDVCRDALVDYYSVLYGQLLPVLRADINVLPDEIDALLDEREDITQALKHRAAVLEPSELDRRMHAEEIRATLLEPIFAALAGHHWNRHRELLGQLDTLEYHIRAEADDHADSTLTGIHRLRRDLLDAQLGGFIEVCRSELGDQGQHSTDEELLGRINRRWCRLRYGEQTLLALLAELLALYGARPFLSLLGTTAPKARGLTRKTDAAAEELAVLPPLLDALAEQLVADLNRLPAATASDWLHEHLPELKDFATEFLIHNDERFPLLEVYAVNRAHLHVGRLKAAFETGRKRSRSADLKTMRRTERHLKNEWVERTMSIRLANRFGPRFEGRLDVVVLVAVFTAIALLGVELHVSIDDQTRLWLLLADSAICLVLLGEFTTRLLHAPDRMHYFRRHWLTDLVPAIPFAAIGLAVQQLMVQTQSLYLLRLMRAAAVFLRKARPFIKVVRIVLFAARGMDRLVRSYRHLLNWDIVFFEPERPGYVKQALRRWQQLKRANEDLRRTRLAEYRRSHARRTFERTLEWIRFQARAVAPGLEAAGNELFPAGRGGNARRVRVEELIEQLTFADGEHLVQTLGGEFPRHVARFLWIARLPPFRWLPIFSDLIRARRVAGRDQLLFTEEVAHRLGLRLTRLNGIANFVADMQGVITAPQLLDRLGTAMVASMRRPRNRLLIFGAGFIVVSLLVEVLPFDWLEVAAEWLRKTLGWPILALGVFAVGVVWLGNRLRSIAQTNADFFTRIAEAKSLGLLGEVKRDRAAFDQEMLVCRVLAPEARIHNLSVACDYSSEQATPEAFGQLIRSAFRVQDENPIGSVAERVYMLYRDYLRGVPFHSCNTGSADQLLGNPSLYNIRTQFLRLDPRENRRLDALDWRRPVNLFGPSLWPRFITLALTQHTGQLIEEYNRHALPLVMRKCAADDNPQLTRFEGWLARRRGEASLAGGPPSASNGTSWYTTTAFTALDFLSNDPAREQAIRDQFGDEVATMVALDRKRLIHTVFGVAPFHRQALAQRSINPYVLYNGYLAHGRLFILPVTLLREGFKQLFKGADWLRETLLDLNDPSERRLVPDAYSDAAVAWRKVLRMHKPLLLAGIRLRARYDPEYLGLPLPGEIEHGLDDHTLYDDLDRIHASALERAELAGLADGRREALDEFADLWRELGAPIARELDRLYPNRSETLRLEALRALVIAYITDYQALRSLYRLPARLKRCIDAATTKRARLPTGTQRRRRGLLGVFYGRRRAEREAFERWWSRQGKGMLRPGTPPRWARRRILRWWRYDVDGMAELVALAGQCDFDPRSRLLEQIGQLLPNLSGMTEQLVILRTIQTLGILELEVSRHIVHGLGEYEEPGGNTISVRIPTL